MVKHYITGTNSWDIVELETHERNIIYKVSEAINYEGRHGYYRQFTCIDYDEGNENTFVICINKIKKGYTKELVDKMKSWEESDTKPYEYCDIIMGNANNDWERPYERFDISNIFVLCKNVWVTKEKSKQEIIDFIEH